MRLLLLCTFLSVNSLTAQWTPGDVYREYVWTTAPDDDEAFLRVGGRYGYAANPDRYGEGRQEGVTLVLPVAVDLEGAIRAEVTLEKVLSHEDSRNLRLSVNGHPPIAVPEPKWIPEPQTEYMYHTDVTVPLPLEYFEAGEDIRFTLQLDSNQRWGWPQNVFYAVIFRVYYAGEVGTTHSTTALHPAAAPAGAPKIAEVPDSIGTKSYLKFQSGWGVERVEYVFVGRDVDWSGRGVQERKHWQTYRGEPHHIIGSSEEAATNFAVEWDTEWLPDQETFGVQARALGTDGKYRVSKMLAGLSLAPRPYRVDLYAPAPAPRNWVTRNGEFSQIIHLPDSIHGAKALQLAWVSWSPCYANGVFLNHHLIWDRTADCYVFATHEPTYKGLEVKYLQAGENVIRTGKTPLFRGQMVHGMEVQWPGFQLKVKYVDGGGEEH